MRKPESMDELVYYTSRDIGNGEIAVWVFKEPCPKCKKALMGKPVDKGKVKMRANVYVCPECGFSAEKSEYEDGLTACVEYTCPKCGKHSEKEVVFKRKRIGGVETLRVSCDVCGDNMDVTKKMKEKRG
ncbi:MAG: hypothetical protein ABIG95_00440 [Candidatus Woesearchaeota archaeon]